MPEAGVTKHLPVDASCGLSQDSLFSTFFLRLYFIYRVL